jgi:hypothetical protein
MNKINEVNNIRKRYKEKQAKINADKIIVGIRNKKMVSKLNYELFQEGKKILKINEFAFHIGWTSFSNFIDWLEENYEIKRKHKEEQ